MNHIWQIFYIAIFLQCFVFSLVYADQAGSCFSSSFSRAIGYILQGFLLGEMEVDSVIDCKRRCVVMANCRSLNILSNADESFMCQLNSHLKESGMKEQFVQHGSGEYYGLKVRQKVYWYQEIRSISNTNLSVIWRDGHHSCSAESLFENALYCAVCVKQCHLNSIIILCFNHFRKKRCAKIMEKLAAPVRPPLKIATFWKTFELFNYQSPKSRSLQAYNLFTHFTELNTKWIWACNHHAYGD